MDNTEFTISRNNPHIDPVLSVWGFEIPIYLFLGGLTAGLLILSGVYFLLNKEKEVPFAVGFAGILAPVILSLGMVFLFLDLTHKLYVWRLYLTWEVTSPMSWGSWALILVYPISILFGIIQLPANAKSRVLALLSEPPSAVTFFFLKLPAKFLGNILARVFTFLDDLASKRPRLVRSLAMLNIGMGVFIGIYTGILLSSFIARPFWNTPLLGFLFLASGLSGASAVILMGSKSEGEERLMLRLDLGLLIIEGFVLALILVGFYTQARSHNQAGGLVMGGSFTGYFWMLVILQGILFPIFMEVMELKNKFRFKYITPLAVLAGGLLLRFLFVYIGQFSRVAVL